MWPIAACYSSSGTGRPVCASVPDGVAELLLLACDIEMDNFGEIVRLEILSSISQGHLRKTPDPRRGSRRQEHSKSTVGPL